MVKKRDFNFALASASSGTIDDFNNEVKLINIPEWKLMVHDFLLLQVLSIQDEEFCGYVFEGIKPYKVPNKFNEKTFKEILFLCVEWEKAHGDNFVKHSWIPYDIWNLWILKQRHDSFVSFLKKEETHLINNTFEDVLGNYPSIIKNYQAVIKANALKINSGLMSRGFLSFDKDEMKYDFSKYSYFVDYFIFNTLSYKAIVDYYRKEEVNGKSLLSKNNPLFSFVERKLYMQHSYAVIIKGRVELNKLFTLSLVYTGLMKEHFNSKAISNFMNKSQTQDYFKRRVNLLRKYGFFTEDYYKAIESVNSTELEAYLKSTRGSFKLGKPSLYGIGKDDAFITFKRKITHK